MKRYFDGKEEFDIPVDGSIPLSEALAAIGSPEGVHFVVVRDGQALKADDSVSDDDTLSLVRFVSGG